MKKMTWILACCLLSSVGCLYPQVCSTAQKAEKSNPEAAPVPPKPVTAEQVSTNNAHKAAEALRKELDDLGP